MAEPFDNTSPGSETRRYADYIDPVAGEELFAGEAVTIDSNGEAVRVADTGTDVVAGVAYINQKAGERVTVKTHGSVVAKVNGAAVSLGGTAGAGDGTEANGIGELAAAGSEYQVLDGPALKEDPRAGDGTEADYAEVYKL